MWLEHLVVGLLNRRNQHAPENADGLKLGSTRESGRHLRWPTERRFEHAAVLGHSGSGKTHFLELLATQHMSRGEGFAFFDFHGDATRHLLGLASRYPAAADRLIIIDPTDDQYSPGLNPLEPGDDKVAVAFSRAAELAAILRQRWGVDAFGARTEELLRNTLYTLAFHEFTLVEAPLLLTSTAFRTKLVSALQQTDIRDYWQLRYEPLSEAMKSAFREPLLNKITAFLVEPAPRHLLGQQHSTIDLGAAMNQGKWLLINLAKGKLRDHAHTLGNLLFAHLQFAVMARVNLPESQRPLFTIFCDEVQNLAENDLITLFAEGRKFGVSLITANQFWEQLPRELRATLLSAGTHVFFRVSAADASVLAGELSVALRHRYQLELTQLPRGSAIVRIGSERPEMIRVPSLPWFSPEDGQKLRSLSAAHYMKDRRTIEAAILARRGNVSKSNIESRANNNARHEGQRDW